MIDQEQLWLQYLKALSEKVQLAPGEALQALYPYQTWDWGGRDPSPNSFPFEQWLMLNVVPADPYQNTNSGAAASQTGFDTAYQNWFSMLAIGNLDKDQAYGQLQDGYNAALAKYTTDYQNAQNTWKNQTNGAPDFTTWLNDPAQFGVQSRIAEDKNDVLGKQAELDQYRQRIQTPIQRIVDSFNNPNYQTLTTDPTSGKSVSLRSWETVPENAFAYVREITGNNFGGDATAGHADKLTITAQSETYEYNHYFAEGGAGWWDDFIGMGAEGSFDHVDWSKADSNYGLTINWQDLAIVAVSPTGWFAGSNIASYVAGPYATGFDPFPSGTGNFFFGPGGSLSRIYTGMVVAYRPYVEINAGSSFSSYLKEQWEAKGGLEIGPFFFGSETSGEKVRSTATVDGANLVLESQSPWPMIIGMKSAWTITPPAS